MKFLGCCWCWFLLRTGVTPVICIKRLALKTSANYQGGNPILIGEQNLSSTRRTAYKFCIKSRI